MSPATERSARNCLPVRADDLPSSVQNQKSCIRFRQDGGVWTNLYMAVAFRDDAAGLTSRSQRSMPMRSGAPEVSIGATSRLPGVQSAAIVRPFLSRETATSMPPPIKRIISDGGEPNHRNDSVTGSDPPAESLSKPGTDGRPS